MCKLWIDTQIIWFKVGHVPQSSLTGNSVNKELTIPGLHCVSNHYH